MGGCSKCFVLRLGLELGSAPALSKPQPPTSPSPLSLMQAAARQGASAQGPAGSAGRRGVHPGVHLRTRPLRRHALAAVCRPLCGALRRGGGRPRRRPLGAAAPGGPPPAVGGGHAGEPAGVSAGRRHAEGQLVNAHLAQRLTAPPNSRLLQRGGRVAAGPTRRGPGLTARLPRTGPPAAAQQPEAAGPGAAGDPCRAGGGAQGPGRRWGVGGGLGRGGCRGGQRSRAPCI